MKPLWSCSCDRRVRAPRINLKGRVVLCGGISQYNSTTPSGPVNYLALLTQRARMEGFIVFDYADRFPAGTRPGAARWIGTTPVADPQRGHGAPRRGL